MDDALDKALKKKQKLLKQLQDVDQFIELYKLLFDQEDGEKREQSGRDADGDVASQRRHRGKPAEIADAAERAIRSLNRPIQRGELVSLIEREGIDIHSDDKARYIGTVLWRQGERFVNIEGEGYWLTGVPVPHQAGQMSVFE